MGIYSSIFGGEVVFLPPFLEEEVVFLPISSHSMELEMRRLEALVVLWVVKESLVLYSKSLNPLVYP